ncbi:MAG: lipase family protein [Lachnospirales bacterium]
MEYISMVLSALSYVRLRGGSNIDFSKRIYRVEDLLSGRIEYTLFSQKRIDFLNSVIDENDKIRKYRILSYEETSKGMGAYAFLMDTNDIIFAYRGTELFDYRDIVTDFKIGIGSNPKSIGQFKNAIDFAEKTLSRYAFIIGDNVYFTGHSLGGGLASYVALSLAFEYNVACITFNGVGVAHSKVSKLDCKLKNTIVDIAFFDDLIGAFGEEVGTQIYIKEGKRILKNFSKHSITHFFDYIFYDRILYRNKKGDIVRFIYEIDKNCLY